MKTHFKFFPVLTLLVMGLIFTGCLEEYDGFLYVEPESILVPTDGGEYTIKVNSNTNWHIHTYFNDWYYYGLNWIATPQETGYGSANFSIVVKKNDSGFVRTVIVGFFGELGHTHENDRQLITLTQEGVCAVTPTQVTLTKAAQISSGTNTLAVACKDPVASWMLTSREPWLKLSLYSDGRESATTISGTGNQTIYLVVTENTVGSSRIATVTVNGTATIVAMVRQQS